MSKTARVALTVISLILFLGIPALSVVRIWDASSSGERQAQRHFTAVVHEARGAGELLEEAEYAAFADTMRPIVEDTRRLSLLLVMEKDGSIDYGWSRSRARLPENISEIELEPVLYYREPWERQLDASIARSDSGEIAIAAIYETLDPQFVFQTLRDGLLAIITFALLVLIVLIASLRPEGYAAGAETAEPEGRTDPEGRTEPADSSSGEDKSDRPPESQTTESGPPLVAPDSGLSFSSHLPRRLSLELERAAENDLDLSLFMVQVRDSDGSPVTSAVLGSIVLEQFPFEDLAFEYSDARVCVILPGTDLDTAMRKAQRFVTLLKRHELGSYTARIGASSRNGRLVESDRILTEAREALSRTDQESPIVGFRPDPDRYRSYIATRMGA